MVVQTTSTVVLCDHFSATAPRDLRKRNIATNIALNTSTPITVHTASATLLRWYGTCDQVLAPRSMFNCHGPGAASAAPPNDARAKAAAAVNDRLLPPDVMSCTFVEPTCAAG